MKLQYEFDIKIHHSETIRSLFSDYQALKVICHPQRSKSKFPTFLIFSFISWQFSFDRTRYENVPDLGNRFLFFSRAKLASTKSVGNLLYWERCSCTLKKPQNGKHGFFVFLYFYHSQKCGMSMSSWISDSFFIAHKDDVSYKKVNNLLFPPFCTPLQLPSYKCT